MSEEKFSILFLSASSSVFDALPEEFFQKWSFYLVKITTEKAPLERLEKPDMIIVDTYSLGIDFLDKIRETAVLKSCILLVIDEYHQSAFIDKILEKGANGYLHIDNFSDDLEHKIRALMPRKKFTSLVL